MVHGLGLSTLPPLGSAHPLDVGINSASMEAARPSLSLLAQSLHQGAPRVLEAILQSAKAAAPGPSGPCGRRESVVGGLMSGRQELTL